MNAQETHMHATLCMSLALTNMHMVLKKLMHEPGVYDLALRKRFAFKFDK